ncbi:29289_t:CDS:1, partial [Gigaspora margarita]
CYLVKSSKDNHYEVSIKDQVQQNDNIKLAHFECTCVDFRFHGIACKHIFAIYQKFYIRPIIYSASNQAKKESKEICDVTFDNWVEALKKVWDWHTQENQNNITDADVEVIMEMEMKRKANISLYNDFQIPNSDTKGTNYNIKKQMH